MGTVESVSSAERLRALVKEATPGPWDWEIEPLQAVDARLIALAPQLAELVADMGEALEKIAAIGDDTRGWAGREAGKVAHGALRLLDALFSEEAVP